MLYSLQIFLENIPDKQYSMGKNYSLVLNETTAGTALPASYPVSISSGTFTPFFFTNHSVGFVYGHTLKCSVSFHYVRLRHVHGHLSQPPDSVLNYCNTVDYTIYHNERKITEYQIIFNNIDCVD
jgi:hypothetical protein